MNYGKMLAILRAAKGLQQKDIAYTLGVTPSYISRIEKGERPLSSEMIKTLAHRYSIPIELLELLGQNTEVMKSTDRNLVDELSRKLLDVIIEG